MQTNTDILIGLIGQGLLYEHIKHHLEYTYRTIEIDLVNNPLHCEACTVVVYCCDHWSPGTLQEINRGCMRSGVALLPVYTQFDQGIIGPLVIPWEKGCTSCAELRKLAAIGAEDERELVRQCLFQQRSLALLQPLLTSFSRAMLTQLACLEIAAYLQTPDQARVHHALLSLSLETLEMRMHRILAVPYCPDCGKQAEDTARIAAISLQSRPKPAPFVYRVQQHPPGAEQLRAEYVDALTGIVQRLELNDAGILPVASTRLHTESSDEKHTANGTGCAIRADQSKVVAILEAIERYAGMRPRGKRTGVHASYNQLGSQALDPTTLGLHSVEQYALPGYRFVPYDHDLVCNWVWGYSFQRQSPILVPERCAYYSVPGGREGENPPFVAETSNGCALGNNLEEAIFHGILELAERDAFLLTWYAQLKLPRLELRSVSDPTIRMLIEHIEHHTGYTIHAFNATLDHAFPCLWLMGVDEKNRAGWPKVRCAAGSHLHPEQALLRALRELAVFLSLPLEWYQQRRLHALKLLANPDLVKVISDHPLLYCLPEAFDRFDFFPCTQPPQSFQQAFSDFYQDRPIRMDLRDDLDALIDHYLKLGIDVIVVDQTAPEYASHNFRSAKILMPGLLPMTFGQQHRRTTGLQRLYQLPFTLDYRDHPLTEAEINSSPHPFS